MTIISSQHSAYKSCLLAYALKKKKPESNPANSGKLVLAHDARGWYNILGKMTLYPSVQEMNLEGSRFSLPYRHSATAA